MIGVLDITAAALLEPSEVEAFWADRAGTDGIRAHQAIWKLVAAPEQNVPFLKKRLHPVTEPDPKQIARLLTDLDSPRPKTRDTASRELERLGERAASALHRARANPASLEVRRRLDLLLAKLDGPVRLPEDRRALRAVEALEHCGTAGARALLEVFAGGTPEARLTREARASLQRLKKRAAAVR